MTETPETKIAVLEEKLSGLREQAKAHQDNVAKMFADQNEMIKHLFEKVDVLNAALNRGKGAFTASLLLAGAIGTGVTTVVEYFLGKH
jgi:hypothetical protein